ncbi:hypothetical protein BKA93DRAFT_751727 [Sparassis latifolia]
MRRHTAGKRVSATHWRGSKGQSRSDTTFLRDTWRHASPHRRETPSDRSTSPPNDVDTRDAVTGHGLGIGVDRRAPLGEPANFTPLCLLILVSWDIGGAGHWRAALDTSLRYSARHEPEGALIQLECPHEVQSSEFKNEDVSKPLTKESTHVLDARRHVLYGLRQAETRPEETGALARTRSNGWENSRCSHRYTPAASIGGNEMDFIGRGSCPHGPSSADVLASGPIQDAAVFENASPTEFKFQYAKLSCMKVIKEGKSARLGN